MLIDLEAANQYILKIDVYLKLIVQVADADANINYPGLMVVVLIKKQSTETLKLIVNFQLMKKYSFVMD